MLVLEAIRAALQDGCSLFSSRFRSPAVTCSTSDHVVVYDYESSPAIVALKTSNTPDVNAAGARVNSSIACLYSNTSVSYSRMVYEAYVCCVARDMPLFYCFWYDRPLNWLSSWYDTPIELLYFVFCLFYTRIWYIVPFCSRGVDYFIVAIFYELVQAYVSYASNLHAVFWR